MVGQLVDHPLPVDLLLGCVVQHMQADQPRQQVVVLHGTWSRFLSYRISITKFDNTSLTSDCLPLVREVSDPATLRIHHGFAVFLAERAALRLRQDVQHGL